MMESAEQMPTLIQTEWFVSWVIILKEGCQDLPAIGGNKTARTARKRSGVHIALR